MRFLITILLCAAALRGAARTELGELNGAKYRIDVPENWNGGLVVYCHGYATAPGAFKEGTKLPPVLAVFTEAGYAVAQSGYAAGGWAIQEAVTDTEALRRYFSQKFGAPKESYLTGHSMGGFLTMMMMERLPGIYKGGLALCGPLAAPSYFLGRGAFDARVVFDYYFPGVLPAPDRVPAAFTNSPEKRQEVLKALEGAPEKAASLRRYTGLKANRDVADSLAFVTYVLKELQQRSGGNPFDNRNVVYEGEDANALNDGVKRYAADKAAAAYVEAFYTPTGRLFSPLLAVHTTYDPLVPPHVPNMYSGYAEQAGNPGLFVQQYVKREGHCAISAGETAKAFTELREWVSSGAAPHGGGL